MVKVSIIVPVYNGEKYLRECLDSIKNQTLEDIEIICVDDGSTDSSLNIIEEYKKADSRFQILRQQNQYAGVARNTGLDAATGEYVIFWDCDDYFALDALEKMYQMAAEHHADICICDAQDFDEESGDDIAHAYLHEPFPETEVFNINQYKQYFYSLTSPVTWNKLILRKLMTDENIRFQALKHSNDGLAIYTAMSCAERIVICKEKLIFYRVNRPDSLMGTYGEQIDSIFLAYEQLKKVLEEKGILDDPEILRGFRNKVLGIYLFTMKYCNTYEQYRMYYEALVKLRFPNMGLVDIEEGYIFNSGNEEKYYNICKMSAEEYAFWQYQTLALKNRAQKQKTIYLKGRKSRMSQRIQRLREKNAKLGKDIKQKKALITEQSKELEQLRAKVQEQDKLLSRKSVKLALKLSMPFHSAKEN